MFRLLYIKIKVVYVFNRLFDCTKSLVYINEKIPAPFKAQGLIL